MSGEVRPIPTQGGDYLRTAGYFEDGGFVVKSLRQGHDCFNRRVCRSGSSEFIDKSKFHPPFHSGQSVFEITESNPAVLDAKLLPEHTEKPRRFSPAKADA